MLYGRCFHRGALLADGHFDGENLICGVHGWAYRVETGVSVYDNNDVLTKFPAWIEDGVVHITENDIKKFEEANPQSFIKRDEYLGYYSATHWKNKAEPENAYIQKLSTIG